MQATADDKQNSRSFQKGEYFKDEEVENVMHEFGGKQKANSKNKERPNESEQGYEQERTYSGENSSEKTTDQKDTSRQKAFSESETKVSMDIMQRLVEMQATGKKLTDDQKKAIMTNPMLKDEHKVILLQMLNDPNPKQTLRAFYKSKEGQMHKEMQQQMDKRKNPLQGLASFVKENSRMQFD